MEDGFARTYGVELLFEQAPQVRKTDLLAALRRRCGKVEPLDGSTTSEMLSFVYPDYINYQNAVLLPQTSFFIVPQNPDASKIEPALQQSWDWPEARAVVSCCRHTMLVTDLMSSGLEYKMRLTLFQHALSALLEVVSCQAIHWRLSQRFVNPDSYRFSKQPDTFDPMFPAVNVRLFNINSNNSINDSPKEAIAETLMDTMGLAALGVPDLQCHFFDLDLNAVARVLYNSAAYLFDKGDVIENGQTIQGIRAQDRWRCQHEAALVGPERIVLDIDPGKPYAAGGRH